MARRFLASDLQAIEDAVRRHPGGVAFESIARELDNGVPTRTLQFRLSHLVQSGRLIMEGSRRWARYRIARSLRGLAEGSPDELGTVEADKLIALSKQGAFIRSQIRRPVQARTPVGYDRTFLDAYRPNVTFYLSQQERAHLAAVGTQPIAPQPAGTFARQILSRLLIDLSWNSSRLEGNTYSLLDTKRLIELGETKEGRDHVEAQMILNHKDAIEFLVDSAGEITFDRHTILNLHAMLASNLLDTATSEGRLRRIAVGIAKSVFHPLEVPQLIEECFDRLLAKAAAIADPFEQALFFMVQLPYLQPFDDVNKRVSRIGANIPLIKANLAPLSFTDVPRSTYTEAILGVYELNKVELLKDVFMWAYERSADRYRAVRQSLGEPDPFRLRHRDALKEVVREIVLGRMGKTPAIAHLNAWIKRRIDTSEREHFRTVAEDELLALHEGNFARYRIRPAEFEAWQRVWEGPARASSRK